MKTRYRRTAVSQYLIVTLILVSIVGFGVYSAVLMTRVEFDDYFALPWAAGRAWLLQGESPYDPGIADFASQTLSESAYLAELPEGAAFNGPVINLVFYLPFSLLPYEVSRAIWVTVLAISGGMVGFLSLKLSGLKISVLEKFAGLVLILVWFPSAYAILTGHISPVLILLILAGIALIINGQDTTAGFLLALSIGYFATTGLAILLLLVWGAFHKRWSIIGAFFSGLAFMLVITLLMLPSWPMDWLAVILRLAESLDWIDTPLMGLAALLPGIESPLVIILHSLFFAYLLILWATLFGKPERVFTWKTIIMLVLAFLFNLRGATHHLWLVLPAMFMVFRFWSERWGFFGRFFSWVMMLIITVGSWFLIFPEINFSGPIEAPLLTIGLPLLVFLGMVWIRWWAIKIPRPHFES